jgi:hypothetical protein
LAVPSSGHPGRGHLPQAQNDVAPSGLTNQSRVIRGRYKKSNIFFANGAFHSRPGTSPQDFNRPND